VSRGLPEQSDFRGSPSLSLVVSEPSAARAARTT